jgi:membrane peptidoglycan carboxypeptidase
LFPFHSFDGNTAKTADKKKTHSATIGSLLKYFCQLTEAVIASEDGSFLIHNGFDFKAIKKHKGMREVGK